jgi:hypothetical protein
LGRCAFTTARTAAITFRRSGGRLAKYAAGVVSLLDTIWSASGEVVRWTGRSGSHDEASRYTASID